MSPVVTADGSRRRLDHDRVVAAAEEIVDELGWDSLTMVALAARLGTKASSLYNHVSSIEGLRAELQGRTVAQLGRVLIRAAIGRGGREGFLAITSQFREFAQHHPHRYDGMTRAPIDPDVLTAGAMDASAALSGVIRSYGIAENSVLFAQVTVFGALHGVVSLEMNRYFGDLVDYDELWCTTVDAVEARLATLAIATNRRPNGQEGTR